MKKSQRSLKKRGEEREEREEGESTLARLTDRRRGKRRGESGRLSSSSWSSSWSSGMKTSASRSIRKPLWALLSSVMPFVPGDNRAGEPKEEEKGPAAGAGIDR